MDWTKEYCGVQHLNGLKPVSAGGPIRQITINKYNDKFVEVYALGPAGFTPIWEQTTKTVDEAKRAGEEFARKLKAFTQEE